MKPVLLGPQMFDTFRGGSRGSFLAWSSLGVVPRVCAQGDEDPDELPILPPPEPEAPPAPAPIPPSPKPPKKRVPNYLKFVFGGSAGMLATCFVQPLDLVKNRMQLSAVGTGQREFKTSFHCFQSILKNEGALALYTGLSAGLLRQASYTTTRLGVYNYLFETFSSDDGTPPSFLMKVSLGMTAGCVAAFVGTPAEVSLIRMTSDGRLPLAERRNYKNVFNALYRIVKEEGVFTLWRGALPTMGRAMVVNAAQLASYSQAKEALMSTGYFSENIILHFWASMISGLVTTIASMPVDIAKTRIQSMKKSPTGKAEYSGALDVLSKVIRNEGFFALWKGFTPYYARLGPHTVLTFIFLEQMNSFYKTYVA
ncbi:unnamed protein product [Cyprideis torosa]|uniref:Mitochondrial 2-oxoglutarate/malate carrier protein n=1 Tax=Cyprideis torosa TaxID=163714 RepID=A0A7R8W002_9CRUS|nr:unnamed protein product [Cyprideis torosa]CAG0879048.1 unnamed protein product [Cyprideis torosa]